MSVNSKRSGIGIWRKEIMTDEKLIALIKKKPEQGIAAAIDLYGGAVRTICSSVLESREDIEEAVSQVFYRLWKYAG